MSTGWLAVYAREVLCPCLRPGQLVEVDRLKVHKRAEVEELLAAKGCEVVFLSSCSPDLNPIAWAFSKIKTLVRRAKARTREALDEVIAAAIKARTLQDVMA